MRPLQGVAQGAQPITSYNFGAGNVERVKKVFGLLLTVSLAYSMTLWALVMLFPQLFAMIFTPDAELIAFTGWALRIYMAAAGIFGAQMACQMTFISLGNAKGVYFSGSHAEIHPFDTAHLYSAAFLCGSDLRGISGGTCGGFSVGGVCGDAVCVSVSESDSGNGGEKG